MHAQQPRSAETVRKIAELALGDALEIILLIELIKKQNEDGINEKLNAANAGQAALVFRNALIARLVTLITRAYARPRQGDLHVRVVVDLLKDNTTRQIFTSVAGGREKVADFESRWARCHGDHRRKPIEHFRDKFRVHLGEPKEIKPTVYKDLFGFGAATTELMVSLALATRVAVTPIDNADPDVKACVDAFWEPWKQSPELSR